MREINGSNETDRPLRIFKYQNRLSIAVVEYSARIKRECETCKNYQRNFSCPPHSPFFPAHAGGAREIEVLCYRTPLIKAGNIPSGEAARLAFTRVRGLLLAELMAARAAGHVIAGSGACSVCQTCAGEAVTEACRSPANRIYSLESLGVNVAALSEKAFQLKLEWSDEKQVARFVSAIGAVFR
jgi:predicted metal-binding protein